MTSKERAELRSRAQVLDPVVMVGRNGITDAVVEALDQALDCHELVKVRFQDYKELTKILSLELASKLPCDYVCTTGFTSVFYRKSKEK